jgi:hypothetical protein
VYIFILKAFGHALNNGNIILLAFELITLSIKTLKVKVANLNFYYSLWTEESFERLDFFEIVGGNLMKINK